MHIKLTEELFIVEMRETDFTTAQLKAIFWHYTELEESIGHSIEFDIYTIEDDLVKLPVAELIADYNLEEGLDSVRDSVIWISEDRREVIIDLATIYP